MRTSRSHSKIRIAIIILLAVSVFVSYFMQLMQIQIVDAERYQAMVQGYTVSTQPIKAVRGEIVDRNGIPLVQNKMSYDVMIDKAFLETGTTNEIILRLIGIFEKNGQFWIDNLPINQNAPFVYLSGREEDISILKTAKNAQEYATAEHLMFWLIEEYGLEDYSLTDARKIAGVRYEMDRRDFSLRIPYTFAKDIDNALVIYIKEHGFELPGVTVETNAVRMYPDDSIAPHILGMTGPLYREDYEQLKADGKIFNEDAELYDAHGYMMDDTIGKSGIEKAMEDALRGNNGLREIQVGADGQVIEVTESIPPVPGSTVVLTIDSTMQRNLQEYLEAQTKFLAATAPEGRGAEANAAAGVVLNVKTGEVLAAATYPSYRISDYVQNYAGVEARDGSPLINRAIIGQYTPGSIFKPAVAIAGLTSGAITAETVINCTHVYTFFAPSYTPECLSYHGPISLDNAIGWSCNIFFYETGRLTGIDTIDKTAKELGLGEYTGIEIEEAKGQRSNPEVKAALGAGEWYGADTIQTAIGQMYSRYTPLQLANYAATIANHGKRMKLTLIKEVRDYSMDEIVKPFEPVVAYTMVEVPAGAWDDTIKGMINATSGSAGGTFGGYPITVASKTGTPQVTEDVVNSTYIAFAPADDPQIAVAIIIEKGWQGYTGAPVAKAIFDDYFGIEHVGAVASGPQNLKNERLKAAEDAQKAGVLGDSGDVLPEN